MKSTARFLLRVALVWSRHAAAQGGLRTASVVLAVPFIVMALAACGGDKPKGTAAVGRSLEVHLAPPVMAQKISFVSDLGRQIIQARASNRQLALVKVTVVNRTSTVIPLKVDIDAAQLGDRRGQRINALDPFAAAKPLDTPDPEAVDSFVPFLWGEVELARFTQAEGWMVFEVPVGLRLGSFWWDEVDFIVLDFPS